jgi:hypothetical protein
LLKKQGDDLSGSIAELPAEISNPMGSIHTLILDLDKNLNSALLQRKTHTGSLHDLQKSFTTELLRSLPIFMPYCEREEGRTELYTPLQISSEDGEDVNGGEYVYIEEVHQILDE